MRNNPNPVLMAGILVNFSILCMLSACSNSDSGKKTLPPAAPVTTATATVQDIPVNLRVVGRAEAFESVALKSRVDGQVAKVLFTEGQHVKKGEVLIQLDPTDFSARHRQVQATATRDAALFIKAQSDTARYVALKERNFVSEEKVNDIRTNEAAARATLRASQAGAEVARLQLSYATIRAPFDGIVGARLVFPGSSIKINDTVLAVVNRVQPLLVSFSIPEKILPRLHAAIEGSAAQPDEGLRVDINVPGETKPIATGRVRFIDNSVDITTGTIQIKAEIPNTEDKLTPGQFLNASLRLNTLNKAVTIPDEAIQQGSDGRFVFVVKADSTVELRPVEVAAAENGLSAISKGLKAGEVVVTDGQLRLVPGTRIKPRDATAPTTTTTH